MKERKREILEDGDSMFLRNVGKSVHHSLLPLPLYWKTSCLPAE
jgi:hypothetical protein